MKAEALNTKQEQEISADLLLQRITEDQQQILPLCLYYSSTDTQNVFPVGSYFSDVWNAERAAVEDLTISETEDVTAALFKDHVCKRLSEERKQTYLSEERRAVTPIEAAALRDSLRAYRRATEDAQRIREQIEARSTIKQMREETEKQIREASEIFSSTLAVTESAAFLYRYSRTLEEQLLKLREDLADGRKHKKQTKQAGEIEISNKLRSRIESERAREIFRRAEEAGLLTEQQDGTFTFSSKLGAKHEAHFIELLQETLFRNEYGQIRASIFAPLFNISKSQRLIDGASLRRKTGSDKALDGLIESCFARS